MIDINIVNYVLSDKQFYAGQTWLTRHLSNFEILLDNWALTILETCKCASTEQGFLGTKSIRDGYQFHQTK